MMTKMPAAPVAAATRPTENGITSCPARLPMMRSEFAVPRVSGVAKLSSAAMVAVMAMPSAKPATATTTSITANGSGSATAA